MRSSGPRGPSTDFSRRTRFVGFPFAVFKKFGDDDGGRLAALIAYYGFFSLFPLLLVLVSVLGFVLSGHPDLRQNIIDSAFGQFPVIGRSLATGSGVNGGLQGSWLSIVVGGATALWAGLGVAQAAQAAMNTVWDIRARAGRTSSSAGSARSACWYCSASSSSRRPSSAATAVRSRLLGRRVSRLGGRVRAERRLVRARVPDPDRGRPRVAPRVPGRCASRPSSGRRSRPSAATTSPTSCRARATSTGRSRSCSRFSCGSRSAPRSQSCAPRSTSLAPAALAAEPRAAAADDGDERVYRGDRRTGPDASGAGGPRLVHGQSPGGGSRSRRSRTTRRHRLKPTTAGPRSTTPPQPRHHIRRCAVAERPVRPRQVATACRPFTADPKRTRVRVGRPTIAAACST